MQNQRLMRLMCAVILIFFVLTLNSGAAQGAAADLNNIYQAYQAEGLGDYVSKIVEKSLRGLLEKGEERLLNKIEVLTTVRGALKRHLDTTLSEEVNKRLESIYNELDAVSGGALQSGDPTDFFIDRFSQAAGGAVVDEVREGIEYILGGALPSEVTDYLNKGPEKFDEYASKIQEYLPGNQLDKFKDKILSRPLLVIPNEVYGGILASSAARHFANAFKGVTVDTYELQRGIEVTKVLIWQLANKEGISLTVGQFLQFVGEIKGSLGLQNIGFVAEIEGRIKEVREGLESIEQKIKEVDKLVNSKIAFMSGELKGLVKDIEEKLIEVRDRLMGPIDLAHEEMQKSLSGVIDEIPRSFDDILEEAELKGTFVDDLSHRNFYMEFEGGLSNLLDNVNSTVAGAVAGIAGRVGDEVQHLFVQSRILDSEKVPKQNPSLGGPFDPVLLHNGEFYHQKIDLTIPGRGLDFKFTRVYRSRSDFVGALGRNWTHNYAERLVSWNGPDGKGITHIDSEGKKYFFLQDPDDDRFISPPGVFSTLGKSGDNWVLTEPGGLETVFSLDGRLLKKRDRFGNEIRCEYDGRKNLSAVIDTLGRRVRYNYNEKGFVDYIEDFIGRRLKFDYDERDDLISVTLPATETFPYGKTTQYRYAFGFTDDALNHNLVEIIDPKNQRYLVNLYGVDGYSKDMVVSQVYGDPKYQMTAKYVPLAIPWVTAVSGGGENAAVQRVDVKDLRGVTRFYIHNLFGNLLREGYETRDGREVVLKTHKYNHDGLRIESAFRDGISFKRTYDTKNPNRLNQSNLLSLDVIAYGGEASRSYKYSYAPHYQLRSEMKYPSGGTVKYFYDFDLNNKEKSVGLLIRVEKGDEIYNFRYDRYGRIVESVDPRGVVDRYTYGNYLEEVARDLKHGTEVRQEPVAQKTGFEYDRVGNVVGIKDANGNLWRYKVNLMNQLVEETTPAPFNYRKKYRYDANDNVEEVVLKKGNGANVIFRFEYDLLDHLLSEIVVGENGSEVKTSYGYDPAGNLTRLTEPEGNKTEYIYDEEGRVVSEIRGAGAFDQQEIGFEYNNEGRLSGYKDGSGATYHYIYNGFGEVTEVIGPNGVRVKYERDLVGNISAKRWFDLGGGLLEEALYEYNIWGRPVGVKRALWQKDPSEKSYLTERWRYDAAGNVSSYIYADGRELKYDYDGLGRLRQIEAPLGNVVTFDYDKMGNLLEKRVNQLTTKFSYDSIGRLTKKIDPSGNSSALSYDSLSNVTNLAVSGFGESRFEYDDIGRLATLKRIARHNNFVTKYTWDKNGRLISITDPNGNETKYIYDNLNRLVRERFPNGTEKNYSYDRADRLVEVINERGDNIKNIYDSVGRLIRRDIRRAGGVVGTAAQSFAYDGLARLISSYDGNNPDDLSDDAVNYYYYDSLSRKYAETRGRMWISKLFDSSGGTLAMNLSSGKAVYKSYDPLKRVKAIRYDGGDIVKYNYEKFGEYIYAAYSNGVQESRIYDFSIRLLKQIYSGLSGGVLEDFGYVYNRDGFLLRCTEEKSNLINSYQYDELGRLKSFENCRDNKCMSYDWNPDGLGNWVGTFKYGKMNEILSYSYDASGNTLDNGQNRFEYDALGRLTNIRTTDGAMVAKYIYDVHDRRVGKILYKDGQGKKVEYLYDDFDVALDFEDGNPRHQYIYSGPIDRPVAVRNISVGEESTYFYHADRLGSVIKVSDQYGKILGGRSYTPYGDIIFDALEENSHTFTGREYDPESGLIYFRHRFFNPKAGRFLTPDPLGYKIKFSHSTYAPAQYGRIYGLQRGFEAEGGWIENATPPRFPELNLYEYARSNPLFWLDPLGLRIVVNGSDADYQEAREYLTQSRPAAEVFSELEEMRRWIDIVTIDRRGNSRYEPARHAVYWNPAAGLIAQPNGIQSPALGLLHELAHVRNDVRGVLASGQKTEDQFHTVEERNVIQGIESEVARDLGEPLRQDHASTGIVVPGVLYRELWLDGEYNGPDDYRRRFETIPSPQSIYHTGHPELFSTMPPLPKKG